MAKASVDGNLKAALVKAYGARACLFHRGVGRIGMRGMFALVDAVDAHGYQWNLRDLQISDSAFRALEQQHITPHKVFAHPAVLQQNPRLTAYYRNLVAVSQKGMSQLGLPTTRFEKERPSAMADDIALELARTLNGIISQVIDSCPGFDLATGRDVAFTEIGTELQGTWANTIGKGAAKQVEDILAAFLEEHQRGTRAGKGRFQLTNGWRITFGSEPDIKFTDKNGVEQIVVEIKGSLDRAGAQTRYGETKKSFAKALKRNPRCHTIYLASCFTNAVVEQIEADGQVRERFNLTSILYDADERDKFLTKLFYILDRPI